jgi:hypothetical protein
MATLSFKASRSLVQDVAQEARRRGISKSELLRKAAETETKRGRQRRKPTFLELAGDLIGSVKGGPPDLSSNPEYMEGFGE